MHPRAMKQMYGFFGCHNPGGFSGPSLALPTVTALKVLIRRCGEPIRLHLDRIGCAFRRCALGCGPSPSSPATGNARGGPNKRRCRRSHAARLRSHRRPGRDGTNTCETGVAAGARRALRAPPRPYVLFSRRLLRRTSCPVRWLRGAAVRTSSLYGGTAQRRVESADSPGPPRRLSPCKRGVGQHTLDP